MRIMIGSPVKQLSLNELTLKELNELTLNELTLEQPPSKTATFKMAKPLKQLHFRTAISEMSTFKIYNR